MKTSTQCSLIKFEGRNGKVILARTWDRLPLPKAGVLILHGMGEHSARYARFAAFLNQNGYAVYASDHRGHGLTAGAPENLGCNGLDGFNRSVEDNHIFFQEIRRRDPEIPLFLFGHSFGSFLAQEYITRYGSEPAGLILLWFRGNGSAEDRCQPHAREASESCLQRRSSEPFYDRSCLCGLQQKSQPPYGCI